MREIKTQRTCHFNSVHSEYKGEMQGRKKTKQKKHPTSQISTRALICERESFVSLARRQFVRFSRVLFNASVIIYAACLP